MYVVRAVERRDLDAWIGMRLALWPDQQRAGLESDAKALLNGASQWVAAAFIAVDRNEAPLGFLELNLRSIAEGCESSPVPHVEAWYVVPRARRAGIGRKLMTHAETWARERGYRELTSDTTDAYPLSIAAHLANGFEEVERLIAFRKPLI